MKNTFLTLLLSTLVFTCFCQEGNHSVQLTKKDYLQKSKKQKIVAGVLLTGGTIAWLAGVSKYMNQDDNVDGGGEATMIIGGIAGLSFIPFFILASKNKKKAASFSFTIEQSPYLKVAKTGYTYFPAISYRINIR